MSPQWIGEEQMLTLLQHGDSQFPTGAFAFSAGVEGLLADGVVATDALPDTITHLLRCRWSPFDRVAVRHAWRADGNPETLSELDALVEAALLAPAERTGSAHAGAALLTTHSRLETPGASSLNGSITRGEISGHRTVIEGAMWRAVGLTEAQAALLSGYGFVTTLATASVRLGHLGALAHQRLVARLLPEVASLATSPLPAGPVLRAFSPLAEIAIMRHPARDHALFAT